MHFTIKKSSGNIFVTYKTKLIMSTFPESTGSLIGLNTINNIAFALFSLIQIKKWSFSTPLISSISYNELVTKIHCNLQKTFLIYPFCPFHHHCLSCCFIVSHLDLCSRQMEFTLAIPLLKSIFLYHLRDLSKMGNWPFTFWLKMFSMVLYSLQLNSNSSV